MMGKAVLTGQEIYDFIRDTERKSHEVINALMGLRKNYCKIGDDILHGIEKDNRHSVQLLHAEYKDLQKALDDFKQTSFTEN